LATTFLLAVFGCESNRASERAATNATVPLTHALPKVQTAVSEGYVGVVVGRYSADVAPRFAGTVREVHVRLGDRVRKGSLLAIIDLPTMRSELRNAEVGLRTVDIERERAAVELEAAEDYLARRLALGRDALASAEDIATARYRKQLAAVRLESTRAGSAEKRSRIDQLRKDAADAELRAPFDGLISVRYVDPGASVTSEMRIVRIISADDLIVRFAVPESKASSLAIGHRIEALVGDQNIVLHGKVEKIAPEVDAASRMIVVEATIDAPQLDGAVIAGVIARVSLQDLP